LKCFTEELVDQEKAGYKKAYEWFGKQYRTIREDQRKFSNAPDQFENTLPAALCGKI